jgi:hypothetical protein
MAKKMPAGHLFSISEQFSNDNISKPVLNREMGRGSKYLEGAILKFKGVRNCPQPNFSFYFLSNPIILQIYLNVP